MAIAVRPVCIDSTTFLRGLHTCRRRTVSVGQRRSGATRFPLNVFAGIMVEANFSRVSRIGNIRLCNRLACSGKQMQKLTALLHVMGEQIR